MCLFKLRPNLCCLLWIFTFLSNTWHGFYFTIVKLLFWHVLLTDSTNKCFLLYRNKVSPLITAWKTIQKTPLTYSNVTKYVIKEIILVIDEVKIKSSFYLLKPISFYEKVCFHLRNYAKNDVETQYSLKFMYSTVILITADNTVETVMIKAAAFAEIVECKLFYLWTSRSLMLTRLWKRQNKGLLLLLQ